MSHKLTQQNFNMQLKALLSCFGKLPTENNLPGTLSTREGNGPSIYTPAYNSKVAFSAENSKACASTEPPNPPADEVHCSLSTMEPRFETSGCAAFTSRRRGAQEGYLAGIGDPSHRRDAMVCSRMPAAVTVFNERGGVVHQNTASIRYMGDRVNCMTSCSSINVLALVFQLDPEKLDRMMHDIDRENAGRWRGIVRVPCGLVGAGLDAHALALAQKTKLISDSGSTAHAAVSLAVVDTSDRDSRSMSYSLAVPRAIVRMTFGQGTSPGSSLHPNAQPLPGRPSQISARDLTPAKADFLPPNFHSCFATAAAQRMVSESQAERTTESGPWRADTTATGIHSTSQGLRSGSPLVAAAGAPSRPLDHALSEGARKACLGIPTHAVLSNSGRASPQIPMNMLNETRPLETRGTFRPGQKNPSHGAGNLPTMRLAPCTSMGSIAATSFIPCQMASSCPPAWTPCYINHSGPVVAARDNGDLEPSEISAPERGSAFTAVAGRQLNDSAVCSFGVALKDAVPGTTAAVSAAAGEGTVTQGSLTWDTGTDPLATSTFGLVLSRHTEAVPVSTPNFAVPATLDGSVGGGHVSVSSAHTGSALAASPGAGSVGDDSGGVGDCHTSSGAQGYKERALDMGIARQISASPRDAKNQNTPRTSSWLTPRACAGGHVPIASSCGGGVGGSGSSISMPSRVPSSVGSLQNSPHSRALVFASSLRNAPTATQILAEGSRRSNLHPRASSLCSHDVSPGGITAAAADSGPRAVSKEFLRTRSSVDNYSQPIRIARTGRSSLSSRTPTAAVPRRPLPDIHHDAVQLPPPPPSQIIETTTPGATPARDGDLTCTATSVPLSRDGFGERKAGAPRRAPSFSKLLRTVSIGRMGFLEVAAGFRRLPKEEAPVVSANVTATADAIAPTANTVSYATSINNSINLAAVSWKKLEEVTGPPNLVVTAAAGDAAKGCAENVRLVEGPSGGDDCGAAAGEAWRRDRVVYMERDQHQHHLRPQLRPQLQPNSQSKGTLHTALTPSQQQPLQHRPSGCVSASTTFPMSTNVQADCWHEIWALRTLDTITGEPVIIMSQHDVSAKVIAERHLALVMEAEHRLLEQLFPKHILTHVTEEWIAEAEKADEKAAGNNRGHCGSTQVSAGPVEGGTPAAPKDTTEGEAISAAALVNNPRAVSSAEWRPVVRDCNALATWHPQVTLLFADIKGFTPMCKQVTPREVMTMLNDLFSRFDAILDKFGVFKVETIGDCYFVAGGLIREDEDGMAAVRDGNSRIDPLHAHKVFMFAKAMLSAAQEVRMPSTGEPVQIRIGISSGPVVSGVVGTRMPRFCLFGDTVNTTSRMESTGQPGAIHASESAYLLLKSESWESTGGIEVKGKGVMQTFLWRPTLEARGSAVRRLPASSASAAAAAAAALKLQSSDAAAGLPLSTGGRGGSVTVLRYTTASGSSAVVDTANIIGSSRAASSVVASAAVAAATLAVATTATATTLDATSVANTIGAACETVLGIHTKASAAAANGVDDDDDSDPLVSMLLSHVD